MRDPANNQLKAWCREYEERPFFFCENAKDIARLVAWAEEPEMTKSAFYGIIERMGSPLSVKVRICAGKDESDNNLWTEYGGEVDKPIALRVIHDNEQYVFADGMHQLWMKDPNTGRYLIFDDHGAFFLYFPTTEDKDSFRSLGFEERQAAPIFSKPHFHCTKNNSENAEMRFVSAIGLQFQSADSL